MTTAEQRRGATRRVVLRCTHAAVIALVSVLAVLVHHEIAAPMTHIPPGHVVAVAGMAGMDHGSAPATPAPSDSHMRQAATTVVGDDGSCDGAAMQHCSSAGVSTMKLAPPAAPAVGHTPAAASLAVAGRDVPGTPVRAPPDLSLLSRFLL